jgi:SAM-dependent methyltransferase
MSSENSLQQLSEIDINHLRIIRSNVSHFLAKYGSWWGDRKGKLLDIAPQNHDGARPYFSKHVKVETLDIDPAAGATYCADLCKRNDVLSDSSFDLVVCTEVLEHTLNPFAAVAEIFRILKPGGYLLASAPFNFRIHGPLPDCWRFSEHGWRSLTSSFEDVEIAPLEDASRFLMPIHYTVFARKPL